MLVAESDLIPGRQAGRLIPKSRPKALQLHNYLDPAAVSLPASTDRRTKAAAALARIYCNDRKGCCVISSKFHGVGLASGAATGTPIIGTDQEVLSIYRYFSPWDTGCNMAQVLDYLQATGITMGGAIRKIDGYVAVNYTNADMLRAALDLFGVLAVGMSLPNAWYQSQPDAVWKQTNSRIVGGHEVCAVDYDETGVVISTWGHLNKIEWAAMTDGAHIDEIYVPLMPEWFDSQKVAVSGLQVAELRTDLDKIGAGTIPPINVPAFEPFVWT